MFLQLTISADSFIVLEMKINNSNIKAGMTLIYNDGRAGHTSARAVVLSVTENNFTVQFEDRADDTTINFSDRAWIDFLTVQN